MADTEVTYRISQAGAEAIIKAYQEINKSMGETAASAGKVTNANKNLTNSIKLSNTAVTEQGRLAQRTRLLNNELAFTIQDGAYAFNDLRMGVLGMSNNLPRVAYQMKELAIQTGSWGTAIKTAALGLFSFNGIMSLAVGALVAWTALSGRSKKSSEEMAITLENLTKSTSDFEQSLKKINEEIGKLSTAGLETTFINLNVNLAKTTSELTKITATAALLNVRGLGFLGGLFGASQSDLDEMTQKIIAFYSALNEVNKQQESPGRINRLKADIDALSKAMSEAETYSEISRLRTQINQKQKELNELLKPTEHYMSVWRRETNLLGELYKDILDTVSKINSLQAGGRFTPRSINTGTPIGERPATGVSSEYLINQLRISESEIRSAFPIESTLVSAFEGGIADAGRQAFESIFGQANSLLEIFIQNVVGSFASLAAQDIGGGLLNILTGGATGGASGILDFLGLSKASQSQQIVIELDGERLAVAMVKSGTSQRVNQLNSSLRRN